MVVVVVVAAVVAVVMVLRAVPWLTSSTPAEATGTATLPQLRAALCNAQRHVRDAQQALLDRLQARQRTSRAGYLRALADLLPCPERAWQEEWGVLTAGCHDGCQWDKLEDILQKFQVSVQERVQDGWPLEHAQAYTVLSARRRELAVALRERDPRLAACTYALTRALCHRYDQLVASDMPLPQAHYRNLVGAGGLAEDEARWTGIECPDCNGFCGLTSTALCRPVKGTGRGGAYFSEHGMRKFVRRGATLAEDVYAEVDSPIVCFVNAHEDEQGIHSIIDISTTTGAFPPNTLFRLIDSKAAGDWFIHGGLRPKQRLLVVSATFRRPQVAHGGKDGGGKMCEAVTTLSYGDRSAFVQGLDDILERPLLLMSEECDREQSWTDWKGIDYSLRLEWAYVSGPALIKVGCVAGTRDLGNQGVTPAGFLERANRVILEGRASGVGLTLPEAHAFLTQEEVLSVRLYSGPAYQPINDFLRQIARLNGEFRRQLAQHPGLTFVATVANLCRAIRKLAAVAFPSDVASPLWRGVRGVMPPSFWIPDKSGMVCAVDMAFMSTSRHRSTPVSYMGPGANVLWELQPRVESDTGFHRGADISPVSQFSGEREVLFPPCTMLEVKNADIPGQSHCGKMKSPRSGDEDPKSFIAIRVLPRFL